MPMAKHPDKGGGGSQGHVAHSEFMGPQAIAQISFVGVT